MNNAPFNKALSKLRKGAEKALEDLEESIISTNIELQRSMQEYLSSNINIEEVLRMLKGVCSIPGILDTSMPGVDYYAILGLNKTASNSEVKKRYKEIMQKLHPDKAGDEMTFLASLVNTAYSNIKKERGI